MYAFCAILSLFAAVFFHRVILNFVVVFFVHLFPLMRRLKSFEFKWTYHQKPRYLMRKNWMEKKMIQKMVNSLVLPTRDFF